MRRIFAISLFLISYFSSLARAQSEHAAPLPGGTLRVAFGGDWQHYTERFGRPNPSNPALREGQREPLGAYFSSESLGVARLPLLTPVETELRAITGLGGYALNLGRASFRLDASVRSTPIRLDYAPSRRLGFSLAVPIVRARMSVSLTGADTTDTASLGNVGLNPNLATPGTLDAFRNQAEAALAALRTQAASGPTGLRAQAQALFDRYQAGLCGMYALAGGSASASTSPCFRGTALPAAPVLPVTGSEAADSMTAIVARSQAEYENLRTQFAAQGVAIPAFTQAFALPATPLDAAGLSRVFSDPSGALSADSLSEVVRTGIGDVEVGAWLQLADGARLRSQVAVTVRLPTGKTDQAANFVDIGTGDHQLDVEIAARNDFLLGSRFRVHLGGRYGIQMADELERRVTPWYLPVAPASSLALVRRDLGDYFGIDVSPQWQLDEAFSFGFGYHYFSQQATTFEYVNPADETTIGFPASVLGQATEIRRMRAGAGITYSSLERFYAGRARLPLRVSWSYQNTFWGRGGQVPVAGVMMLIVETHFRL